MAARQMDHARSDDPVLDRLLRAAGQQQITGVDLSLERISRLLARMASPHRKLPPVLHVAGTNGKGSTCAFLRAALEAAGHQVHVFTSPHLVRVNERIRISGALVSDADLAEALADVLRFNAGQPLSFFEAMTAAAFLLFAAHPADACILEVGLGGRLDSTNVVEQPLVTGISQLAMDHVAILGPTIRHIAAEKAAIAKRGVPLVTQKYPGGVAAKVAEVAALHGAKLWARGEAWDAAVYDGQLAFRAFAGEDEPLKLPLPKLAGAHQADNAALAVAMLRAQTALNVPDSALRSAMGWAQWPGRLQRLTAGPLPALLPAGSELWVDGGHNPAAGKALAAFLRETLPALPLHLVVGMLATKDHAAFLKAFPVGTRISAVPVAGHEVATPGELALAARGLGMQAEAFAGLADALACIERPARVLIAGSLHLAGEALAANGVLPA